ncbi:MAG: DUF1707 domain-containing protein [Propionibacteriaceae bacterium]|nr:DUF1707 domain-containing protein [Propionibacteriaceae bacterium]
MSGSPVEAEYAHDASSEVTTADRDDLSNRLNDAFAGGALTMEDYQARLNALFQASKRGELVPVVQGLPAQYRSKEPAVGGDQAGKPGELAPLGPAPRTLVLAGVGGAVALVVLVLIAVLLI